MSLGLAGKIILDMLCYYDRNAQLGAITNSAGSIITFSDSRFGLTSG